MSYIRNAASPKAFAVGPLVKVADGSLLAVTTGVNVRYQLDSDFWGAGGGTLAVDAASSVFTYAPLQAETNGDVLNVALYIAGYVSACATMLMDPVSLPAVAAGTNGGLLIAGSNAATTFVTLTSTGALTCGSTALGNTTMGTLTQTGAASLGVGSTVTLATLALTGNMSVGGTTTHTGAVTLAAGINVGTVTGTLPNVTVGGYAANEDPLYLLTGGANTLAVDSGHRASVDVKYVDGAAWHSGTTSRIANNLTTMFDVTTQNLTGAMYGGSVAFPGAWPASWPANWSWSTLTQSQVTGGAYDVTNASCLIHLAADQAVNVTKWGGTALASSVIPAGWIGTAAGQISIVSGVVAASGNWSTGTPPTAAAIATAVWTDLLASTDFATSVSIGKLLKDDIDAALSTRSTLAAGAKMDLADSLNATGVADLKTKLGTVPASGNWNTTTPPTAGAIATAAAAAILKTPANLLATAADGSVTAAVDAAAVWDAILADHDDPGSTGAALAAAGSAGDPWSGELPGEYAAGTAGYLVGISIPAILARAALITAGGIEVLPGPAAGEVLINAGDDYLVTQSRQLVWSLPLAANLSTATVTLSVYRTGSRTALFTAAATAVSAGTADQLVQAPLTAAQTILCPPGYHTCYSILLANYGTSSVPDWVTLQEDWWTVRPIGAAQG